MSGALEPVQLAAACKRSAGARHAAACRPAGGKVNAENLGRLLVILNLSVTPAENETETGGGMGTGVEQRPPVARNGSGETPRSGGEFFSLESS